MEFDFSQNYFELFGLDVNFDVDVNFLLASYRELQAQFHPDRFVGGTDQDRRMAMQVTTFINEAYQVLKDEQLRARYLLQNQGVPFDAEKDTTQDLEFLAAQMNLREEIDEVENQSEPLDRLDKLAREARNLKQELVQQYQREYAHKAWDQAKDTVLKMQFFSRLQQQIANKQEALEDELL